MQVIRRFHTREQMADEQDRKASLPPQRCIPKDYIDRASFDVRTRIKQEIEHLTRAESCCQERDFEDLWEILDDELRHRVKPLKEYGFTDDAVKEIDGMSVWWYVGQRPNYRDWDEKDDG